MSRVGKQAITIPAATNVTLEGGKYIVVGSKGTLQVPSFEHVTIESTADSINVVCLQPDAQANFGLFRTLLYNAVTGVSSGWKRELEINGVGMRASVNGSVLNLSLGFSHPVVIQAPEGINFTVTKNIISISGIDKQLVGETAAQIRRLRKPEPYKGKGIRYTDEYVRRKAGKTGKSAK